MAGRESDVASFGSRALLVAVLALPACIVFDDPSHCANLRGDATCVEAFGDGWACSVCERGAPLQGCSNAPIETACRFEAGSGSGDSGSGGSTSGGSGGSGTTGLPVECDGTGAVEGCPDDRPYCVEGVCSGCEAAGGHDYCAGLSESVPQCNPSWGHCVECYDDASPACGEGQVCGDDFACGACTQHEQCPMSACNVFRGTCMDDATVLWVDDDPASCDPDGDASEGTPLCDLDAAIERVAAGETAIVHLRGGSYTSLVLPDCAAKYIAVIGDEGAPATIDLNALQSPPAVEVACGSELMLYRVRLRRSNAPAVQCHDGGKLSLQQVLIDGGTTGVDAQDCRLRSLGSRFVGTAGPAISATDGSDIELRNDVIGGNAAMGTPPDNAALVVVDSAAELRFVTLADNDALNLACGGTAVVTAHSSLVGDTDSGMSIDCLVASFDHSVIDNSDVQGDDNVALLFDPGWFVDLAGDDYRLLDSEGALAEIGQWNPGDPRFDLENARRVEIPGARTWPGADQP